MTEAAKSAQDIFSIIIELWKLASHEQRVSSFKSVSPTLYHFLSVQTSIQLACLSAVACPDVVLQLIKHTTILPAIESRGVSKIQTQILDSIRAAIEAEVISEASLQLKKISTLIGLEVVTDLSSLAQALNQIRSDYHGFMQTIASRMLATPGFLPANRQGKIFGFEPSQIQLRLRSRDDISIQPLTRTGPVVSGARVLGAGFAAASARWETGSIKVESAELRQSMIEQINKVLALGGFQKETGAGFPAAFHEWRTGSGCTHLNLSRDLHQTKNSFAVLDSLSLVDPFVARCGPEQIQGKIQSKKLSAGDQAELLRGLSALVRSTQDWRSSEFDSLLGGVTVDRFITELPAGAVHQNLFPKGLIFSAGLGLSAMMLERWASELTPVFLMGIDQKIQWANEQGSSFDINEAVIALPVDRSAISSSVNSSPAAMAGIVDVGLTGSQFLALPVVKTEDVARSALAVADFLDATADIQKTKSAILLAKGKDGKPPVQTLNESRARLSLLLLAFANFLSHEMQGSDGGINETFDRVGVTVGSSPRRLSDQTVAIRALLRASQVLRMDIYQWAALDAYAFMNRQLFDQAHGFYRVHEGSPVVDTGLPVVTQTLRTLEELRPSMQARSQVQWDSIAAPWYQELDRF